MTEFHNLEHIENLENQADRLTTLVANSDMSDEETRNRFIDLVRKMKEQHQDQITSKYEKRIDELIYELEKHKLNQIAQSIVTQFIDVARKPEVEGFGK